ncbi:MAG: LbtU family siderophore porin [Thermodesulfobacteriota bacterium]
MRSIVKRLLPLLTVMLLLPLPAGAASAEMDAVLQELMALKAKVAELEKRLADAEAKPAPAAPAASADKASIAAQEAGAAAKGLLSNLDKRIKLYGELQAWGLYEGRDRKAERRKDTRSEFSLRKADLFVEAQINEYTKGLIHFIWEQDKTEPVDLDEGYILVGQTNDMPFYAMAGRMYPAIGSFESFLITDTITKEIYETQASALEVGYKSDWASFGVAAFRGRLKEISDGADERLNSYFAYAGLATPEGMLGDLKLSGQLGYMNNAASGFFRDEIANGALQDLVGAWSAQIKAEYGMFALIGEYIRSTDSYKAGELGFAPADAKPQPYAFNLEAAVMPWEKWVFAARYEGAGDVYDRQPERQWGLGAQWEFLKDTTLGLEYMRGDYQNEDTRDRVTAQVAVKF